MEVKIIVSHRVGVDADIVDNPIYLNIRAGAALAQNLDDPLQGDNTGDNISERVASLCEYTPLYWAWKNLDADYYGLCHYRRYLSFSHKDVKYWKYLKLGEIKSLSKANQKLLQIDDENYIKRLISDYDMVLPYEYDSSSDWIGDRKMPLKEQWLKVNKNFLTEHDFDVLLGLINKHSPKYYEPMLRFMNGHRFRGFNCFVMKKELFNEFCEFVFPILLEFDDQLDKDNLSEYQMRAPGFAGEWLFSMWTHEKEKESGIRVLQKQLVMVDDPHAQKKLEPKFGQEIPPFVFIERGDNIPRLAVAIESFISSKQGRDKLDIVILQRSLDSQSWEWHTRDESNKLLMEMVDGRRDISMRFYNPKAEIGRINAMQFLNESCEEDYYAALIPWILTGYDEAVIISENVFFKKSPIEWYQRLINGAYKGWGSTRNLIDNQNRKDEYAPDYDLVICDLKYIREKYKKSDVINSLLKNRSHTKYIEDCYKSDMSFIGDNGVFRDEYTLDYIKDGIPAKYYKDIPEYDDAYVVKVKDAGNIDMSHGTRVEKFYWRMAIKTAFYNDLLSDWMDRRYSRSWTSRKIRKMCNISPMDARSDEQIVADTFFPSGSIRREMVNKIVPQGSKQWSSIKNKTKKLLK